MTFKKLGDLFNDEEKYRRTLFRQQTAYEVASLSDTELVEKTEYFLKNSFGVRRVSEEHRDSPVYDHTLVEYLIPEILSRLRRQTERKEK